ncbi:ATP-binding protein [Isoptericola sp. b441]|uniref:ATP-binding protein n=1 Tax=Actinotalea lenta TaxID=3064654 RepID=A0ABT9D850_9CELL|nr:ATP-binding protein [Isoptericola sp. b441]MDO8107059.1 ATP-binding protein [Isoptericola sp. b441]
MAHITTFRVEGLAGRAEPIEMRLDRGVNIFWGFNGSGKTSLLRILDSALTNDASSIRRVPYRSATVEITTEMYGPITRTISWDSTPSELEPDSLANLTWQERAIVEQELDAGRRWPRWQTATTPEIPAEVVRRLRHIYLPISRIAAFDPRERRYTASDTIDEETFDRMFVQQITERWRNYNNSALANVRRIQEQGLGEILSLLFGGVSNSKRSRRAPNTPADSAYALVRDYLRSQNIGVRFNRSSFAERYSNSPELQAVVERIGVVTDQVLAVLEPQRNFQELLEDLFGGRKNLELDPRGIHVTIGDEEISLMSLSSGEKQLLQILLSALAGEESSVIIDEPELSMHVDWQLRLVRSMRLLNPDCQLILATHSPEVMANVPDRFVHQL